MDTALHILLTALMTLHGADLSLTEYCLGKGACREANPILEPFSSNPLAFGAVKIGIATGSSWWELHDQKKHPKLVLVTSAVGVAFYSYVVVHNKHELDKVR